MLILGKLWTIVAKFSRVPSLLIFCNSVFRSCLSARKGDTLVRLLLMVMGAKPAEAELSVVFDFVFVFAIFS